MKISVRRYPQKSPAEIQSLTDVITHPGSAWAEIERLREVLAAREVISGGKILSEVGGKTTNSGKHKTSPKRKPRPIRRGKNQT